MKVPNKLLSFLRKEKEFLIATHVNPEPDALGSAIAFSIALEKLGKKVILYDKDPVPEFYRFLPGHEQFISSLRASDINYLPIILLDCNTLERAGIEDISFRRSAVIDHHETEKDFGDIKWIESTAPATGLMIFYLIKKLGLKITKEMAINLYSAIAIDTGTFRYNNTTAEVLRVGAELIEAGANPSYISSNLYEAWSKGRFLLFIMALNTLEIKEDIAMIVVTKKMYQKTGTGADDTENFPGFPRMMKDIKVSAFFRELGDNYWKVSLRSRGDINVAHVATLFNGGGHKNASGYKIKASLKSAKKALIKAIKNQKF
ncbi:MAG: bifunctional oligoribonuclease/PAP phosphatase NrnA [Nitrospirota bacterium]